MTCVLCSDRLVSLDRPVSHQSHIAHLTQNLLQETLHSSQLAKVLLLPSSCTELCSELKSSDGPQPVVFHHSLVPAPVWRPGMPLPTLPLPCTASHGMAFVPHGCLVIRLLYQDRYPTKAPHAAHSWGIKTVNLYGGFLAAVL